MAAPQQSKGRWFDSGSSDFLPFEIIIAGQNYLSDHFHLTVWRYCIWVMKENTNKQVTKRREVNERKEIHAFQFVPDSLCSPFS